MPAAIASSKRAATESRIKLLLEEGGSLPASNACVRFDPAHTRLYADGWLVE